MVKKLVGAALCAAVVLGMGGSAFAGEVTGNGTKGGPNGDGTPGATINGHASFCAFSGQQDDLSTGAKVQNFGHRADDAFFDGATFHGASSVTLADGTTFGCNKHAGA